MSNFYKWATKKLKKEQGFLGDFARDLADDKSWPIHEDDVIRMHCHLSACGACHEAHEGLDMAWAAFTRQENKHWFLAYNDMEVEIETTISIRQSISASTRFKILKRDGYRCSICGRDAKDGVKLEIDHKVAVANGGSSDDDNLWTLCFECNRGKRTEEL